jgi:hypothetical protein
MFLADTNLHVDPLQSSPVSDAGQFISTVTDDIDGNTRSTTTPDIGADEYTFIPPLPSAPALLSPANGSLGNNTSLNLIWTKGLYASKYHVMVATDASFTNLVVNDSTVTDSVKAISGLTPLVTYYWRVRSGNITGWSAYTTAFNFKTIGSPTQVVLSSPANGATGQPVSMTFKWFKATDQTDGPRAVTNYWFELSTSPTFATVVTRDSLLTDTTKTVSGLSNSTMYYWRVKAKNQAGWGSFSTAWNFTTIASTLSLNLKVYLEGFWNGSTQVTDTVTVYLANSTTFAFADTAKVVLGTAGTTSPVFSRASGGSYYIVVNHRNHLETWSRLPQTFVPGTPLAYDFTTDSAKAYGFNMKKSGSVWVLFGGDPNRDGSIDGVDIAEFIVQFGLQGYLSCDFDGDGDVTASDVQIIAANFGLTKSVPSLEYIEPEKRIKIEEVLKEINTGKNKGVNDRKIENKKNVKTGNN